MEKQMKVFADALVHAAAVWHTAYLSACGCPTKDNLARLADAENALSLTQAAASSAMGSYLHIKGLAEV